MESLFPPLKTKCIGGKVCRSRDAAGTEAFNNIARFHNIVRRRSTINRARPIEFERKLGLAGLPVHESGSRQDGAESRSTRKMEFGMSSAAATAVQPPSRLLMALELRALHELGAFFGALPLLNLAPRGDGHPVLVLPG